MRLSSRIHVNFPLSSLYVASGKLGLVDLKETLEDGRRVYRVLSYEKGAWHELDDAGIAVADLRDCYLQAIMWADESMGNLRENAGGGAASPPDTRSW